MDAQMKKGLLDIVVLKVLSIKDSYGYEIVEIVKPIMPISENSLYPVLRRLLKQNCLETYSKEYHSRLRKYYHITDTGKQKIAKFIDQISDVEKIYNYISGDKNE